MIYVIPTHECLKLRWGAFDLPLSENVDFIQGINTVCGAGNPSTRNGLAIHVYLCNTSMKNSAFYNADGDFLIGSYMN